MVHKYLRSAGDVSKKALQLDVLEHKVSPRSVDVVQQSMLTLYNNTGNNSDIPFEWRWFKSRTSPKDLTAVSSDVPAHRRRFSVQTVDGERYVRSGRGMYMPGGAVLEPGVTLQFNIGSANLIAVEYEITLAIVRYQSTEVPHFAA